jgi:ribose transport system substrate-binding protein
MSLARGRHALLVASIVTLGTAFPVLAQDESAAPSESAAPAASAAAPAASEAAPTGPSTYSGAEPGSGEGLTIGYISLGESIPFVSLVTQSLTEQAEIAGAELVVCDSEVLPEKALACAQNLAVQGVDGLLNFQLFEDAAAQICAEGPQVPVISIDIHQRPCEVAFMGADNTRAGTVLGEAVGQAIQEASDCQYDALVLMTAEAAGEVIALRSDGTIAGFTNVCGEPVNYTLLDVPSIAIDEARIKFTDYLTTQPGAERIVVLSLNDDMALGALAAATSAGRADDVWIGAHGADPSAHRELRCNPQWIGDVAYFPERYGEIAIPAIVDAIKGDPVPENLFIDHLAINAGNIAEHYPEAPAC